MPCEPPQVHLENTGVTGPGPARCGSGPPPRRPCYGPRSGGGTAPCRAGELTGAAQAGRLKVATVEAIACLDDTGSATRDARRAVLCRDGDVDGVVTVELHRRSSRSAMFLATCSNCGVAVAADPVGSDRAAGRGTPSHDGGQPPQRSSAERVKMKTSPARETHRSPGNPICTRAKLRGWGSVVRTPTLV